LSFRGGVYFFPLYRDLIVKLTLYIWPLAHCNKLLGISPSKKEPTLNRGCMREEPMSHCPPGQRNRPARTCHAAHNCLTRGTKITTPQQRRADGISITCCLHHLLSASCVAPLSFAFLFHRFSHFYASIHPHDWLLSCFVLQCFASINLVSALCFSELGCSLAACYHFLNFRLSICCDLQTASGLLDISNSFYQLMCTIINIFPTRNVKHICIGDFRK
jgi:hypothetical protein